MSCVIFLQNVDVSTCLLCLNRMPRMIVLTISAIEWSSRCASILCLNSVQNAVVPNNMPCQLLRGVVVLINTTLSFPLRDVKSVVVPTCLLCLNSAIQGCLEQHSISTAVRSSRLALMLCLNSVKHGRPEKHTLSAPEWSSQRASLLRPNSVQCMVISNNMSFQLLRGRPDVLQCSALNGLNSVVIPISTRLCHFLGKYAKPGRPDVLQCCVFIYHIDVKTSFCMGT